MCYLEYASMRKMVRLTFIPISLSILPIVLRERAVPLGLRLNATGEHLGHIAMSVHG